MELFGVRHVSVGRRLGAVEGVFLFGRVIYSDPPYGSIMNVFGAQM